MTLKILLKIIFPAPQKNCVKNLFEWKRKKEILFEVPVQREQVYFF
jgi:hypothetical protein